MKKNNEESAEAGRGMLGGRVYPQMERSRTRSLSAWGPLLWFAGATLQRPGIRSFPNLPETEKAPTAATYSLAQTHLVDIQKRPAAHIERGGYAKDRLEGSREAQSESRSNPPAVKHSSPSRTLQHPASPPLHLPSRRILAPKNKLLGSGLSRVALQHV